MTSVNKSLRMLMLSLIQYRMTLGHPLVLMPHRLVLMNKHQLVLMNKRVVQPFRACHHQYRQPKEATKGCWRTMMHLSLISRGNQNPVDQDIAQHVAKLVTKV